MTSDLGEGNLNYSSPTISTSVSPLMRDFLAFVESRPRSYAETMDAWRSSCPRLTIWEDALADDLVRVANGASRNDATVILTPRGRAVLEGT